MLIGSFNDVRDVLDEIDSVLELSQLASLTSVNAAHTLCIDTFRVKLNGYSEKIDSCANFLEIQPNSWDRYRYAKKVCNTKLTLATAMMNHYVKVSDCLLSKPPVAVADNSGISSFFDVKIINRKDHLQKYLARARGLPFRVIDESPSSVCARCQTKYVPNPHVFSKYACRTCHEPLSGDDIPQTVQVQSETSSNPSQFPPLESVVAGPSDVTNFSSNRKDKRSGYERQNHLMLWLDIMQGRHAKAPVDIIERVKAALTRQRITDFKTQTPDSVRSILKRLKLNKYFLFSPYIAHQLNGIPLPTLTREEEDEVKTRFGQIEDPFFKHCNVDRRNFSSYAYILNKFMRLIGRPEYARSFALLKNPAKLSDLDKTWKAITSDLGWVRFVCLTHLRSIF